MTKIEMDLRQEIEAKQIEIEHLKIELGYEQEQNDELQTRVNELERTIEKYGNLIDLDKLILQMKKDNFYTTELEDYIENYCKFYIEE